MAIKAINRFIIAVIILASICHAQVVQTFAALGAQNVFTATPNTFLGIAATSITDSGLTPGNCVQASTGGLLITASAPCGSGGGSGTVGSGTQYQLAIYANTGTTVSGDAALTDNGTSLNYYGWQPISRHRSDRLWYSRELHWHDRGVARHHGLGRQSGRDCSRQLEWQVECSATQRGPDYIGNELSGVRHRVTNQCPRGTDAIH